MKKLELTIESSATVAIPLDTRKGRPCGFDLVQHNPLIPYNEGEVKERIAVAKRIVRTYNTHDDLVTTCENLLAEVKENLKFSGPCEHDNNICVCTSAIIVDAAERVLAEAKGGE